MNQMIEPDHNEPDIKTDDQIDEENETINIPYDNIIDRILNDPGFRMRRMIKLTTIAKLLDISRDQAHKLAQSGVLGRFIDVAVPGSSKPAIRVYKQDFARFLAINTVEPVEAREYYDRIREKRSLELGEIEETED